MAVADALHEFRSDLAQCDSIIANSHRADTNGAPIFSVIDREQITVAAFLNMYIAWERFLESSLTDLMAGAATISGGVPTRFVAPLHNEAAREMVIGVMRFFDYANHDNVKKIVNMYFENGYPFEPHLSAIFVDLGDLRTMRNAAAHISSTTQRSMEALALRIFGAPRVGITLYQLLTSVYPGLATGGTVFSTYKEKLVITAELIANG